MGPAGGPTVGPAARVAKAPARPREMISGLDQTHVVRVAAGRLGARSAAAPRAARATATPAGTAESVQAVQAVQAAHTRPPRRAQTIPQGNDKSASGTS